MDDLEPLRNVRGRRPQGVNQPRVNAADRGARPRGRPRRNQQQFAEVPVQPGHGQADAQPAPEIANHQGLGRAVVQPFPRQVAPNLQNRPEAGNLETMIRNAIAEAIPQIREQQNPAPPQANQPNLYCVCLDKRSTEVIVPCGHSILCRDCAAVIRQNQQQTCPVCRNEIASIITIFFKLEAIDFLN